MDYIFHLACFHGNQSSIASPIQDHENNTLTSLMLFDFFHSNKNLKKVVYSAAGCAVADKTYDDYTLPKKCPVSLFHDSPYSISKLIGKCMVTIIFSVMVFLLLKQDFKMSMDRRIIGGWSMERNT